MVPRRRCAPTVLLCLKCVPTDRYDTASPPWNQSDVVQAQEALHSAQAAQSVAASVDEAKLEADPPSNLILPLPQLECLVRRALGHKLLEHRTLTLAVF